MAIFCIHTHTGGITKGGSRSRAADCSTALLQPPFAVPSVRSIVSTAESFDESPAVAMFFSDGEKHSHDGLVHFTEVATFAMW